MSLGYIIKRIPVRKMDKNSKVLVFLFFLIATASIVSMYYRYILLGDIRYELDENFFQATLLEQ